jgi:hypothetical protein
VLDRSSVPCLPAAARRAGGELSPGHVNAAEAAILRRVLFAPPAMAGAVSCAEAELLFRLKDATLGAANALEWKQLFVQGVATTCRASPRATRS